MPRGPRHHLKRVDAPSKWMLDKLGGTFAPRPTEGSHGLRESIPLLLILREKLNYALNATEVTKILMANFVEVDAKVRTNPKYPAGFQDVITIPKTGESYRVLFDIKGRFQLHKVNEKEAQYKLCKVVQKYTGRNNTPFLRTHDNRVIRYPDPAAKIDDTIKVNLRTGKMSTIVRFKEGNLCMITGGRNTGRIGVIESREPHPGSYEIVHVRDTAGNDFTTRRENIFVIGHEKTAMISLPAMNGVRMTTLEDRKRKLKNLKRQKRGH
mmetsp:Transcript_5579/g.8226  ORF Transcript_5579/g.8226 Transcript_5579/m.8226 type:complete len:267 (+) Transcript_5579:46-846(+)|eukprot:CAMPEP_0117424298 /NCGR_PEP_ID=MMETSP0758-20121206/4747_1 /TAXON_ID=63605 /ORGANISM="Percolomonas cosmopolitus, Strain AE-1 (ATCC 50343)" /LENGTH=266 /DNA_ID=CAMNT_0005207997 /DNA_START=34 /DNA_END=834 /DNA_ORIENTATION=-